MRRILALTVPHDDQRYETCGDYIEGHGVTTFRISDMANEDSEALVLIHELIEYILCKKRGVSMEAIDKFDIEFERNRPEGNEDEPGHDPRAPYHKEHVFAEKVERLLAAELGVNWDDHDVRVLALQQDPARVADHARFRV